MSKSRIGIVDRNGKYTHVWKNSPSPTRVVPDVTIPIVEFDEIKNAIGSASFSEYGARVIVPILEILNDRYGSPECGRTRAVFDRGDGYVIKVPLDEEGMLASSNEFVTFTTPDAFIPVAECYFDTEFEQPLLVMEKLDIKGAPHRYTDLPDWAGWVDGAQVGYNSKRELVAYDL